MLWGISTESWAQLWSGVIGSFVAAVIGGLVALAVVHLTTAQSKRQTEEARQIAAIADLVSAAEGLFFSGVETSEAALEHHLPMRSALIRLQMSGPDAVKLVEAIRLWPHELTSLRISLTKMQGGDWGQPDRDKVAMAINDAVARLAICLPTWTSESDVKRSATLQMHSDATVTLRASRQEARDLIDKAES